MAVVTEKVVYLILFGSTAGGPRKIIHIAHERDGELVPRCNSHHMSSNDQRSARQWRVAADHELEYRVCQRCLNWRGWEW